MEATELRIGNYYKSEAIQIITRDKPILYRYEEIILMTKSILLKYLKDGSYEFSPIPLTEEWLLRFGFDKKDRVINGNFNIGVLYYNGGIDYFEFDVTHIKHVHSLQNLYFSLTQKELTYE